MNGQWIIKEVYFEDGFPKIIRDLKPETPDVTPDDRGSTGEVPGKLKPVGKFAQFTDGIWREVTDGSPGVFLYQREEK